MPYGWQLRGEDVYLPCERGLRLNIFGMIDRSNRYEGFTMTENMTADKVADFLDRMSLHISKRTFVVLDNASVHRCRLMRKLSPVWEKRGLFLFFLPPYCPQLNIAPRLFGTSSREMAQTCGLSLNRCPALCHQQSLGGNRGWTQNQF